MSLFLGLLILCIPTFVFYFLLYKGFFIHIKSTILRLTLVWFTGQYISTFFIFLLAVFLSLFTRSVLIKATLIYLILLCFPAYFFLRTHFISILNGLRYHHFNPFTLSFLFICLLFSILLFQSQLSYTGNTIYRSRVYWDFNIHYPVIQSFVFGDNFPPQNESFAGIPMTYHYPFYLLTAVYTSTGMDLITALNLVSIVTFFLMLVAIIGFCEEIFSDIKIGYLAIILTLTSGSLRFINYFIDNKITNPFLSLIHIISNRQNPYSFSFVTNNPFGYNGTMLNLFYFVAERHMIMVVIFLIMILTIIIKRKLLGNVICIIGGLGMGLFYQWNLAATIMVGCCLGLLLLTGSDKRKTFLLLVPFSALFLIQTVYFKIIMNSGWFLSEVYEYPKLNFNFPTMPNGYPLSLLNFIGYYIYAYGLKIVFLILGLYLLSKSKNDIFKIFFSLILPAFLIINTLQVFPLSIWDNHKFIRPMNVFIDIITAYAFFTIFHKQRTQVKIFVLPVLLLLTFSGILELFPFLNMQPIVPYSKYPTDLTANIRTYSSPKSVFLSTSTKELHLAGRIVFLGNEDDEPGAFSVVQAALLNYQKRKTIQQNIYNSQSYPSLCETINKYQINFIGYNASDLKYPSYFLLSNHPQFSGINEKNEKITYIDLKPCGKIN